MGGQSVLNEQQIIAEIERLELDARNVRRKVEHAASEADKRTLNRQLKEVSDEITILQRRLR
jgi:hypothetical protein